MKLFRFFRYTYLFYKYRRFTMVFFWDFVHCLEIAYQTILQVPNGSVVECGIWKGGMAAALTEVCGKERPYFFFDSFKGLPAPTEVDGVAAKEWANNTNGPRYFNNCRSSIDDARRALALSRVSMSNINLVAGWFEETFSETTVSTISILRLDCDWYESTMLCLRRFWDYVEPGGIVIIDDYYHWQGCRIAIHEFLGVSKIECPIELIPLTKVVCIRKPAFPVGTAK